MKVYKALSLSLMLIFAVVGILFLAIPDQIMVFFNYLSNSLNLPHSPVDGWDLYVILAVGYMYLVTVLAFQMFKHPEKPVFALLLTQAKLVSSILSLALFLLQAHYLVYLANFVIDGAIAIMVFTMYLKTRNKRWA